VKRPRLLLAVLSLPLFVVLGSCGGGVSPSTPPPAPPRPPRALTGIEPFAPRTDIRVGQRVGPLVVYGSYDDGTSGTVDAEWVSSDPGVVAIDDEGFVVGVSAGEAVLTATFEGFTVELDYVVEDPNPRSTRDRPDDISGPQIHFIYAVPSDWEDRNRDRFGEVERSAGAIQNWLQEQTGQRLRVDTYEGRVDVSFLRVSFTHQDGDGFGANLVTHLRRGLAPLGLRGDKLPVFYYEGSSIGVCGSASYEGGGAVYVGPGCSDAELGIDEETASTYEVVMVHELFHMFGAVASCAPNYIEGAHVDDVENDLMFAGVDRQPRGGETLVDVGRDDYYGHGRPDCIDVARSRFLETAPGGTGGVSVEVRLPAGDWPLRCELAH
jgi:hypothetical protein